MPKIKTPSNEDTEDIAVKALSFLTLKEREKELQKEIATLKADLDAYVEGHGVITPKKNYVIVLEHAGVKVEVQKQRRVSSSEVSDALAILKRSVNKDLYSKLVEKTEFIRKDRIEEYYNINILPEELLLALYKESVSYALIIKKL